MNLRILSFILSLQALVCMGANKTFMYFGYGSNLLAKRIHILNPSAVLKGIGELKDHRLDFYETSGRWGGATSTIVPDTSKTVWGDIWEIDLNKLSYLDQQEGVEENIYFAKTVNIHKDDGQIVECRTYQKVNNPPENSPSYPAEKPSKIYLSVIIQGAIESKIHEDYINKLKAIPHNSYYDKDLHELLELSDIDI